MTQLEKRNVNRCRFQIRKIMVRLESIASNLGSPDAQRIGVEWNWLAADFAGIEEAAMFGESIAKQVEQEMAEAAAKGVEHA
jgi:hypothetical protein